MSFFCQIVCIFYSLLYWKKHFLRSFLFIKDSQIASRFWINSESARLRPAPFLKKCCNPNVTTAVSWRVGAAAVPGAAGGMFFGGFICNRLKLKVRGMFKFAIITCLLSIVAVNILWIKCDTVTFAGVNTEYEAGYVAQLVCYACSLCSHRWCLPKLSSLRLPAFVIMPIRVKNKFVATKCLFHVLSLRHSDIYLLNCYDNKSSLQVCYSWQATKQQWSVMCGVLSTILHSGQDFDILLYTCNIKLKISEYWEWLTKMTRPGRAFI